MKFELSNFFTQRRLCCALLLFSIPLICSEPVIQNYLRPVKNHTDPNFDKLDCIYVINLKRRPEKLARMHRVLNKNQLGYTTFEAIDGCKLSDLERRDLQGKNSLSLHGGHIGCMLSHLSVLLDAYNKNFDLVWILEDDIEVLRPLQLIKNCLTTLNKIDPHWDVFYTDTDSRHPKLGHLVSYDVAPERPGQTLKPGNYYRYRSVVSRHIMKIRSRFGLYSYFVSKRGIKKIIDYFLCKTIWIPLDMEIHYIPGIKEYSTRQDIVTHWTLTPFSDTQNPD